MYNQCYLSEHQGNPLIEALPPLVDDEQIILKLRSTQVCVKSETEAPAFIRKKYLHRLEQFVEPSYQYLECFRMVENLIIQSYIPKNPLTNTAQHWLHHDRPDESKHSPSQGRFVPRSAAMSIVGEGGVGKSWMLESILRSYDQVIKHSSYNGKRLRFQQIVWIKVNCPENANVKGLLLHILGELDRLTGSNEAPRALASRDAAAAASVAITRILKSSFVGVLAVDEMQHLEFANVKLKELFIQFILNTLSHAGVPLILAGDPRIVDVIKSSLPISRRVETGGTIFMRGYKGHEWEFFVKELWKYQWTKPKTRLTEELSHTLWNLSTGLPDYAVRIFKKAQELVIGTENETISGAVLQQVYEESCTLSAGNLAVRRNKLNQEESKQSLDFISDDVESNPRKKGDASDQSPKQKHPSRMIHDVNRIQHGEFEAQIKSLRDRMFLPTPEVDLGLLRKSLSENDSIVSLMEQKILFRQSVLMPS